MKTSLWAAILALTLGAMYWQNLQFPVQISLLIHSGNIQFSAVTVCTLNPYRYKEVSVDLKELDLLTWEVLNVQRGYGAEAQMMVHDGSRSPFMEDGGFDFHPGLETSFSMRK
eukprot:g28324.t1